MKNKMLRCVTEGAVMIALSVVLNFLRLPADWLGGTGGSVELTAVPLMVFALRRGWGWGVGAGLVFGTLKCVIGGGVAYGWQALVLDYALAFAALGLAGLLPQKPAAGAVLGCVARYVLHVISGVVIWGQWMPDSFLGLGMNSVWVYSLLYNGVYMAANTVLAAAIIAVFAKKTRLLAVDTL